MQILHPFAGSIQSYGEEISDPNRYRPDHCPQCEAKHPLTGHGFYCRTLVDAATPPEERNPATQAALGAFLTQWFNLEHVLQQQNPGPFRLHMASKTLVPPLRDEYDRLRRIRNDIVHGFNIPPPEKLAALGTEIAVLRDALQQQIGRQKKSKKKA